MKSLIVVFTVIALSAGHSLVINPRDSSPIGPPPGNECVDPAGQDVLGVALRTVLDLIPWDKATSLVLTALSENPEVQKAVAGLTSSDFVDIVKGLESAPEYNAILDFFCNQLHFDVYYYLNAVSKPFGYPQITPPAHSRQRRSSKTLRQFLQELVSILPLDEFIKAFGDLMKDNSFKQAVGKIGSQDFRQKLTTLQGLTQFRELIQQLRDLNIPVDDVINTIEDFFHWKN